MDSKVAVNSLLVPVESDKVSPEPLFLQAKQCQFLQLFLSLIRLVP